MMRTERLLWGFAAAIGVVALLLFLSAVGLI